MSNQTILILCFAAALALPPLAKYIGDFVVCVMGCAFVLVIGAIFIMFVAAVAVG